MESISKSLYIFRFELKREVHLSKKKKNQYLTNLQCPTETLSCKRPLVPVSVPHAGGEAPSAPSSPVLPRPMSHTRGSPRSQGAEWMLHEDEAEKRGPSGRFPPHPFSRRGGGPQHRPLLISRSQRDSGPIFWLALRECPRPEQGEGAGH